MVGTFIVVNYLQPELFYDKETKELVGIKINASLQEWASQDGGIPKWEATSQYHIVERNDTDRCVLLPKYRNFYPTIDSNPLTYKTTGRNGGKA